MQLQLHCSKTVSTIFCFAFFFVRDIHYEHFKPIGNPRTCLVSFCRNWNGVPDYIKIKNHYGLGVCQIGFSALGYELPHAKAKIISLLAPFLVQHQI